MSRTDRGWATERTHRRCGEVRGQFSSVGPDWRPAVLGALVCALVWLASLGISTVPAQAELSHSLLASFGPGGPGVGAFGGIESIAVDQTDGDVYVFDAGNRALYKFDAAGHPLDFAATGTNAIESIDGAGSGEIQVAVDSSPGPNKGDIYIAENVSTVKIYNVEGDYLGGLTGAGQPEACGVAVDPAGNVYVGFYPSTVKKYAPATSPVENRDEVSSITGLNRICNIAADSEGNLYAATYSGGVSKY
jgi:hypothetical protein